MYGILNEKKFAEKETAQRSQLGDKAFLEKYIPQFEKQDKLRKVLLPLIVVIFWLNAFLWGVNYFLDTAVTLNLVVFILWSISAVLWSVQGIIFYTHTLEFNKNKVAQWKDDLRQINEQD